MADSERLCEGSESLIAFDKDSIAGNMFRLGHQPVLLYREGLLTPALRETSATSERSECLATTEWRGCHAAATRPLTGFFRRPTSSYATLCSAKKPVDFWTPP